MVMRNHVFDPSATGNYPVALLMKSTAFNKQELQKNYVNKLAAHGVHASEVVALTLEYNEAGKAPVGHIKEYLLASILPALTSLQTKYVYCADSAFFKVLTGQQKADVHAGYVLPCKMDGYTHLQVVLGMNYQQLIYNPDLQAKLDASLFALASHAVGSYQAPGTGIIHQAVYPEGISSIQAALNALQEYPELAADIEAFSLRFNEAGIGTIAFAPDQHKFVAFPCDYKPNNPDLAPLTGERRQEFGRFVPDPHVRAALKDFFTTYKGKLTWHNAGYDVKVIIYTLWMKDYADTVGLLEGLEIMYRLGANCGIDDTKIITYLATNSTAGNDLKLKNLAQEFAGNWAQDDIKDIRMIPLKDLLQYNGVDCLSTNFVKAKYYPVMVADSQVDLYHELMLPSQKVITQIELTGMPMSKAKIVEIKAKLTDIDNAFRVVVLQHPDVKAYEAKRTQLEWQWDYEERRDKAKHPDKIKPKDRATYPQWEFNPGSDPQLRTLLYEMLGLPIIDMTPTKMGSTGEDTLKKMLDHPIGIANKALIEALIGISQVSTILSTFIPAFERAIDRDGSGIVWLHGNFNVGGTVSGRLSSSDPNLQNIPAKSIFAKLIKEAFMGPAGWVFAGADFNSLEDMISALTTKDPNKLKVYTDGFDGHCLRAAYYYKDELLAEGIVIDMNDPKSVNSLKKCPQYGGKEHPYRQESKIPTFALTYQGTHYTLMQNLGWPEDKAKRIEAGYHQLYVVSDQYVQTKLKQANKDGYVTVAFGLRLRTPLLKQVVYGSPSMPYAAAAEGRTAGNALGQSYGLLNNRAMVDFMNKVWASPYRLDIKPVAMIHDACYLLIREDPVVVEWANRELILSMQWQKLPEIQHPTVKLGANLDIFWPSWANAITLPNGASAAEIVKICTEAKQEYLNPEPEKEAA
jgi:DNA polymerase-1